MAAKDLSDPYFQGIKFKKEDTLAIARSSDPIVESSKLSTGGDSLFDGKSDDDDLFRTEDIRGPLRNDDFFKGPEWKPPPRVAKKGAKAVEQADDDGEYEVVQDVELKTQKSGNSVVQSLTSNNNSATTASTSKQTPSAAKTTTTPAKQQEVKKAEPEKTNIGRDVSHLGLGKVRSIDVDDDLFSFGTSTATTKSEELSLEDRIKALTTSSSSGGLFD
eukprot:TRINITY_DN3117_c0_g1_i1.p1 TRINITY_DN3117_c0_g1~~TRINITY_DN3117_c0_g1_i1.p1  ORF type:complete len:239 (+),score=63.37 TRINITY_DN3117_c0_g1_i1:65-718(+)